MPLAAAKVRLHGLDVFHCALLHSLSLVYIQCSRSECKSPELSHGQYVFPRPLNCLVTYFCGTVCFFSYGCDRGIMVHFISQFKVGSQSCWNLKQLVASHCSQKQAINAYVLFHFFLHLYSPTSPPRENLEPPAKRTNSPISVSAVRVTLHRPISQVTLD